MNIKKGLFSAFLAPIGAMFIHNIDAVAAQTAPTPFSKYGQIQTVQNYSSNPYWNSGSPYNQTMPVPVYAKGPDVNTGTCQNVVDTLIASHCAAKNNCIGLRVSDIRPDIMVQLSQLPGHNFATSCGGYIDTSFNTYVKTYGHITPNANAAFPTAYETNSQLYNMTNGVTTANTFSLTPKKSAYASGVAERAAELSALHAASSNNVSPVTATTGFPQTIQDAKTLNERIELRREGYAPFKDTKPYKEIKIQSEEGFKTDLYAQNPSVFCQRYPDDDKCKELTKGFAEATAKARKLITEANDLIKTYTVTNSQKAAADAALADLKKALNDLPNATRSAENTITEKTDVLDGALEPYRKKKADAEAAAAAAAAERDAEKQKAQHLLEELNILKTCYSSDVTQDGTADKIDVVISNLETALNARTAADIRKARTNAETNKNVEKFRKHHNEQDATDKCRAYENFINPPSSGGISSGIESAGGSGSSSSSGSGGGSSSGSGGSSGDGTESNPERIVA